MNSAYTEFSRQTSRAERILAHVLAASSYGKPINHAALDTAPLPADIQLWIQGANPEQLRGCLIELFNQLDRV